jgi:glycosyltransferase involved in cell wall biosynthesis
MNNTMDLARQNPAADAGGPAQARPAPGLQVGLLTGGGDRHYAFGLAMALASKNVCVDFVGGDEVDSPELHATPNMNFLNLRRSGRPHASLGRKILRISAYYLRLVGYAATAHPKIFHILWNNKFEFLDRTLLMLYYKLTGKKIALTAHNVNAGTRDSNDSPLNRFTLRVQYRLANHIFVHTHKMKSELLEQFGVHASAVSVIPYGNNNAVPNTGMTPDQAKGRLGIAANERTILFFGNIAPYKGLEYLIAAFQSLAASGGDYRLIVAGPPKAGCEKYIEDIRQAIAVASDRERIILKMEFIPDEETELYFKAADILILPYTHIFQSGVLFLGYSFGLPAIAADVGSLREDILEGETGFLFRPRDTADLARTIELYFSSDLYKRLNTRRRVIREYVEERHSWNVVGEMTRDVYMRLLEH